MPATLEFKEVSVSVRVQGAPVELLRNISFSVDKGRTLGLVGESGAGKSMIGRVISGLLPDNLKFSAGHVYFRGSELTGRQARALLGRRIAFVPQEPLSALNPVLTVRQQMHEHMKHLGLPRRDWERYCGERLAEVGMPDPQEVLGRYAHQLSGGQCQRVLIAMAFSGDPELIVADEPTTALDVVTQAQIIRLLRQVQRRHGTAVILITHDLRMAAHVCDEVAVLYAGDIVERGPARRVLEAPRHPYSWALKMATPSLEGPQYALPALAELMPGLKDMAALAGCRFARRCPTRNAQCEARKPMLEDIGDGHFVSCGGQCRTDAISRGVEPHTLPESGQPPEHPLLELRDVGMSYHGRGKRKGQVFHALKPMSLSIGAGELVGVVGESGSGKSTLARLMVGLLDPVQGAVQVDGISRAGATGAQAAKMRETVQMVFQDPDSALNPRRTVERLITQALEIRPGISPEERNATAQRLMQQVGMAGDAMQRFPSQLSGGQKQRVNIARALCVAPRLLVADEIVSGLDVSVQALIMNLLLELNRELGIAVVFISHDLSVIRYLCRRVLVMRRGEVVEHGATEEVFGSPRHPYTRLLLASVPPDSTDSVWPAPEEQEPAVQAAAGAHDAVPQSLA
jgi:peptide/nickel transport system ATP-binding protein